MYSVVIYIYITGSWSRLQYQLWLVHEPLEFGTFSTIKKGKGSCYPEPESNRVLQLVLVDSGRYLIQFPWRSASNHTSSTAVRSACGRASTLGTASNACGVLRWWSSLVVRRGWDMDKMDLQHLSYSCASCGTTGFVYNHIESVKRIQWAFPMFFGSLHCSELQVWKHSRMWAFHHWISHGQNWLHAWFSPI